MNDCVATFYTQFAAMCFVAALKQAGVAARIKPVPRALSSSCGTCAAYAARHPFDGLAGGELEAVYLGPDGGYTCVAQGEE